MIMCCFWNDSGMFLRWLYDVFGDGYKMFRSAQNAYDYGPGLEVVLADYMASQGSYVPYLDGRIAQK